MSEAPVPPGAEIVDGTVAEIVVDTAAVRHNVRVLSELVAADGPVAMMTVVKADGYGHGMVEAGRAAREAGAAWLGVATIREALALRAAGDRGRLLCWLMTPGDDVAAAVAADVDVTVATPEQLHRIAALDGSPRVQLKVDTGLSRGGAVRSTWEDLFTGAAGLVREGRLRITGIWTHPVAGDEPEDPVNDVQETAFREALALAGSVGLEPEVRHFANSAAAVLRPSVRFDLVRCGIASYGLDPAPGHTPDLGLVSAMTVRAPLALVKEVEAGAGVSYGHTWTAPRATTLGLVPVGYGDGVPRHASNRASVWAGGRRRPVRGRICMDQLVIDLDGDHLREGERVTLFGTGAGGEPTAQDWAEAAGTISYEIVTRIGGRLVRRHVDSERTKVSQ